jgi:hypothetical protein
VHVNKNKSGYELGVRLFFGLTPQGLHELVDKGFTQENERQSGGPSVRELVSFAMEVEEVSTRSDIRFGGYAIDRKRPDCCVKVDAVYVISPVTRAGRALFTKFIESYPLSEIRRNKISLSAHWS